MAAAVASRVGLVLLALLVPLALALSPSSRTHDRLPLVPDVSVRSSASLIFVSSAEDDRGRAVVEALASNGHRVGVLLVGSAVKSEERFREVRAAEVKTLLNTHVISGTHVDAARSFHILEKARHDQADVFLFSDPSLAHGVLQARAQGLALRSAAVVVLLPPGAAEWDRHASEALRLADAVVAPDSAASAAAWEAEPEVAGGHVLVESEPSSPADGARWARWLASLQPREPAREHAAEVPWEAARAAEAGEPAVTVVLAHRDQAGQLRAALRSLKQQTYKHFEVVLVDAGSTSDEAASYLDELEAAWRSEAAGWSVVRRRDASIAAARSAGAALARAPYVLLMESSAVLKLNAIERFLAAAASTRAPLLASHATLIHADFAFRRLPTAKDPQHDAVLSTTGDPLTRCLADAVLFAGRQAVLSAPRPNGDERDTFARAAAAGRPVAVVAEALYWLRWSGDESSPPLAELRAGSWEGCLARPAPAEEAAPAPRKLAPERRKEEAKEEDEAADAGSPREQELRAYLASLRAAYEGRKDARERTQGLGGHASESPFGRGRAPRSHLPTTMNTASASGEQRHGSGFRHNEGPALAGRPHGLAGTRRRLLDMKGRDSQVAPAGDLAYIPFGSSGELSDGTFKVFNDFVAYDLTRPNTWYSIGLPDNGPPPRGRAAVAGSGIDPGPARVWVLGGTTGPDPGQYLNDFWVYVVGNQTVGMNFTAANYTGGNNKTAFNSTLNSPFFNNQTNTTSGFWRRLTAPFASNETSPSFACGRRGASLLPWKDPSDGRLYLVLYGGLDGCLGPRGDVAIYDVDRDLWTPVGPQEGAAVPNAREDAAVILYRDRLLVNGGAIAGVQPPIFHSDTWMFDLRARVWTELDVDVNSSISRTPPPRAGAASYLLSPMNDTFNATYWIVTGGYDGLGVVTADSFFAFCLAGIDGWAGTPAGRARGEWFEARPANLRAAARAFAVSVSPTRFLLFGGRGSDGRYPSDPFSASLDSPPPPPNPLVSLNATAVSPNVVVLSWSLPWDGVQPGSIRVTYRLAYPPNWLNATHLNSTTLGNPSELAALPWREAGGDLRGLYAAVDSLDPDTPYRIEARTRAPACGGRAESGPVAVFIRTPPAESRPLLACPAPNVTVRTLECVPRGAVSIAGVLMPNISFLAGVDPKEVILKQWPPAGALLVPPYPAVSNPRYAAALGPDVPPVSTGKYAANFTWSLRQYPYINASCSFVIDVDDLYVPSVCPGSGGACPQRELAYRIPDGQCSVAMPDLRPGMSAAFPCERAYNFSLVQSIPPGSPLNATGAPIRVDLYTSKVAGVADRFGFDNGPACTTTLLVERSSAPQLSVGGAFADVNGTSLLVLGCNCGADAGLTPSNKSLTDLAAPNGTVTLKFEYNATDACEEPACDVGVVVTDNGLPAAGLALTASDGRPVVDTTNLGAAPAAMGTDPSGLVFAVRGTTRAGPARRTAVEFSTYLPPSVSSREFEVHVQCRTASGGQAASAWTLQIAQ